jgi:S1-C subfamily serine protease
MKICVKNLEPANSNLYLFGSFMLMVILVAALPGISSAGSDVKDSMVKIYAVENRPDYDNPWNMKGPEAASGSGCVIAGNRILTNAHVVSDQTFIQVRLHGRAKKYPARVIAVSHEADLALLTVNEPSFFHGAKPLAFGQLPQVEQEVVVYGFPEGGDMLSTTKGVISRIEHHRYVHSQIQLLAMQLDAAVNAGNSGGPVMVDGLIVGVVMQSLKKAENIGYTVPVPVIRHFLTDMKDGRYDGFPDDGIFIQSLENESLKKMYGLKENQFGALVTSITPGSPAENKVFPGDVLLAIDSHPIADDGTIEFRPRERTSCNYYVQQHQVGEEVAYKILRQGQMVSVKFTLDRGWGTDRLVPLSRYDVRPTYFVYGGLVFCPLTLNYILTWGDDWAEDAPYNLLAFLVEGKLTRQDEEVVIIIKALPSGVNNGYEDYVNKRIVEVNGEKIRNLQDLIRTVEDNPETPYVVFKTRANKSIVLNRQKAEAEQAGILETYQIAADRSANLKTAVSAEEKEGGKVAGLVSVDSNM